MQYRFGPHTYDKTSIKYKRYNEEKQRWLQKSETSATVSDPRTWNSSALYKEESEVKVFEYLNTEGIHHKQPVQEGSSIMTQ